MATAKEPPGIEMVEPYAAPEHFITHIGKAELVDGNARIYWCSVKDEALEVKCIFVIPLTRIPAIGRQCLSAAAELHNAAQWVSDGQA